ncbi:TetR/AcrR family transcriptional regulator [Kitasatospora nipponensis]|uniref:TetR/AcrR family transcriptional regulator n=1 Tax=Kitasatospora nipponensis TaxID=258049 RepID=A0ABP4GS84_9ACTN
MDTLQVESTARPAAAPRLRADATRNRERIITAARELFVENGATVPLDDIAKRAGVGNATLYRNFPDRSALVRAVALSVMGRILVRAQQALADDRDSFEALCDYVRAASEERIGALCSLLSEYVDLQHDEQLLAARTELEQAVEDLMARARLDGRLRPDVAPGDLFLALAQLTRPLPGTGCLKLDLSTLFERNLIVFLDGLRAPAISALPGRAVTTEDLRPS